MLMCFKTSIHFCSRIFVIFFISFIVCQSTTIGESNKCSKGWVVGIVSMKYVPDVRWVHDSLVLDQPCIFLNTSLMKLLDRPNSLHSLKVRP